MAAVVARVEQRRRAAFARLRERRRQRTAEPDADEAASSAAGERSSGTGEAQRARRPGQLRSLSAKFVTVAPTGRGSASGGGGGGGARSQSSLTTMSRAGALMLHEKESLFNDYCQRFIDSGERPQNFIQGAAPHEFRDENSGRRRLYELKEGRIRARTFAPMYAHVDLRGAKLHRILQTRFDVVLIDPPMEEYVRRANVVRAPRGGQASWTWDEIMDLPIGDIVANQSFVFLWVGSEEGLEMGRICLHNWGFRRAEDIVWLKTNKQGQPPPPMEPRSALQHTKEHCLMGIRGTVRRSLDGHIIHSNCDVDVIVAEDPGLDSTRKPEELYSLIEHFCQGRRRLELFGEDHNIRDGWVTLGLGVTQTNFSASAYNGLFNSNDPMDVYVGTQDEIEELRPRSPPPSSDGSGGRNSANMMQRGAGGSGGAGVRRF